MTNGWDEEDIYRRTKTIFVCIDKNDSEKKVCGYLECDKIDTTAVRFTKLGVHSDYRNKAIATHMMKIAQNHYKNQLTKIIYLYVFTSNIAAIQCYEKYGFKKNNELYGGCYKMSLQL